MRYKDLTGQRFGRLVVEKLSEKRDSTRALYWDCKCDCGGTKAVRGTTLTAGKARSCGCLSEEYRKKGSTKVNIVGQRFERLVVISETDERTKCGEVKYLCKCDCGNTKVIIGTSLRNGNTRSCGCLISEGTSERAKTHGMSKTRIYKIWAGMHDRCYNPNRKEYESYGGRGIQVCDEWKDNFQAFYDWSMENGYSDDLSIDRENNEGNYEPSNCRWTTRKVQSDNTRQTVHITVNGDTKNIGEWAETIGVARSTISRHYKLGDVVDYISARLKN